MNELQPKSLVMKSRRLTLWWLGLFALNIFLYSDIAEQFFDSESHYQEARISSIKCSSQWSFQASEQTQQWVGFLSLTLNLSPESVTFLNFNKVDKNDSLELQRLFLAVEKVLLSQDLLKRSGSSPPLFV